MRRSCAAGGLAISMTVLAACADNAADQGADTPATDTQAAVSIQVSVPPAPTQTGAAQVRFDPCVRVGDDLVSRAGFDPATRERYAAESVSSPYTRIGCQFWREAVVDGEKYPTGLVTLTSSDTALDEIRKNPDHSVFGSERIGGRDAVRYRTPLNSTTCSASIASADGTFTVALMVHPGPVPVPASCDQIGEIAAIFGESLGNA